MHDPLGLPSKTVILAQYDARWPDLYAREAARIQTALSASGFSLRLEHMGSTAVPGLVSKPIIDILAGWTDESARPQIIDALTALGYDYRGEQGIPGRDFFRRGNPRQYHLHLAAHGGSFWKDHLAFRDLLRTDADAAAAYGALKSDLARRYPFDRENYTDGKTALVRELLARVRDE